MNEEVHEPTIVVRGAVTDQMVAYAREKFVATTARISAPVLAAEVRIDLSGDPARGRPNHVEMTVVLNGTPVRARQSAPTMTEAIDSTAKRLRRRVDAALEKPRARHVRHNDGRSWHHDDERTERPRYYPRPADERSIRREKSFALKPCSLEDALFALETLDHDFYLFVHDETCAEAVVYRAGDGYGLMQRHAAPEAIGQIGVPIEIGPHPATTTLKDAVSVLDGSDAPFEFFVDSINGRAMVVYRRYDGHYGLVSAR